MNIFNYSLYLIIILPVLLKLLTLVDERMKATINSITSRNKALAFMLLVLGSLILTTHYHFLSLGALIVSFVIVFLIYIENFNSIDSEQISNNLVFSALSIVMIFTSRLDILILLNLFLFQYLMFNCIQNSVPFKRYSNFLIIFLGISLFKHLGRYSLDYYIYISFLAFIVIIGILALNIKSLVVKGEVKNYFAGISILFPLYFFLVLHLEYQLKGVLLILYNGIFLLLLLALILASFAFQKNKYSYLQYVKYYLIVLGCISVTLGHFYLALALWLLSFMQNILSRNLIAGEIGSLESNKKIYISLLFLMTVGVACIPGVLFHLLVYDFILAFVASTTLSNWIAFLICLFFMCMYQVLSARNFLFYVDIIKNKQTFNFLHKRYYPMIGGILILVVLSCLFIPDVFSNNYSGMFNKLVESLGLVTTQEGATSESKTAILFLYSFPGIFIAMTTLILLQKENLIDINDIYKSRITSNLYYVLNFDDQRVRFDFWEVSKMMLMLLENFLIHTPQKFLVITLEGVKRIRPRGINSNILLMSIVFCFLLAFYLVGVG